MQISQIIVLAIIQGLTEFLPVSSSAHLVLAPKIFGWQDQGLAFDVAVHLGTLVAVCTYYRKELLKLTNDAVSFNFSAYSLWSIAFATVPVGILGFLGHDYIASYFRSHTVVATSTIIFAIILGLADKCGRKKLSLHNITWPIVIVIALSQTLALIPGASRSGVTISAALLLGCSRKAAANYSFLLSIPVILAAVSITCIKVYTNSSAINWYELSLGAIVACGTALVTIKAFLQLQDKIGLMPFVIYRLLLGIIIFYISC